MTGTVRPTLRRGPRLALLSAAVAILLLGAVIAGVFGYLLIGRGSAGALSAARRSRQFPRAGDAAR